MFAVRDVNMEVLLGVLEDVLRQIHQHDVVLPRALQVAQQPIGALEHWDDVGEQSLAIRRVEVLSVPEGRMVHEMRAQQVQRLQVRRFRRQNLELRFLQALLVLI